MYAAIRPDEWNLPLLVHVLGAFMLVGALGAAVAFQLAGWRGDRAADATAFGRLAARTLLFAALPAWFVMRIGAQWIYSEEGLEGSDEPAWLGIGWITADAGGLLLLIAIILAAVGARRLARSESGRAVTMRIATVLASLALVAYVVALWAMSAKPS